jgi:hypothetical protein
MSDGWQTGAATLLALRDEAIVRCPFCRQTHQHQRQSAGSREVVAGCHTPTTPRLYAIPAAPRSKR